MSKLEDYENHDCGVIALSMTTGVSYDECHAMLKKHGRKNRCGTKNSTMSRAGHDLGFYLKKIYIHPLKAKQYTMITVANGLLRSTLYIIFISGHYAPFIDGVVRDWSNGTRCRVKWVYEVVPRIRVVKK
jgi:hypothetical protein